MSNDYARIKGGVSPRHSPVATDATARPRDLSTAEMERIANNRAFVHEHLPELVPFIKGLHAEGLIDGWRTVVRCSLLDDA